MKSRSVWILLSAASALVMTFVPFSADAASKSSTKLNLPEKGVLYQIFSDIA